MCNMATQSWGAIADLLHALQQRQHQFWLAPLFGQYHDRVTCLPNQPEPVVLCMVPFVVKGKLRQVPLLT